MAKNNQFGAKDLMALQFKMEITLEEYNLN